MYFSFFEDSNDNLINKFLIDIGLIDLNEVETYNFLSRFKDISEDIFDIEDKEINALINTLYKAKKEKLSNKEKIDLIEFIKPFYNREKIKEDLDILFHKGRDISQKFVDTGINIFKVSGYLLAGGLSLLFANKSKEDYKKAKDKLKQNKIKDKISNLKGLKELSNTGEKETRLTQSKEDINKYGSINNKIKPNKLFKTNKNNYVVYDSNSKPNYFNNGDEANKFINKNKENLKKEYKPKIKKTSQEVNPKKIIKKDKIYKTKKGKWASVNKKGIKAYFTDIKKAKEFLQKEQYISPYKSILNAN